MWNWIVLRCPNPTLSGMHTDRHHEGLSLCVEALSKGRYAHPSLVWMPADMRDSSSRVWKSLKTCHELFQIGFSLMVLAPPGRPAQHQSRPDAIFVCSIPGRQAHLDPSKIPPHDRDIHLLTHPYHPPYRSVRCGRGHLHPPHPGAS
eukprot:1153861-Pelagomonas_calceolata.AAC.7